MKNVEPMRPLTYIANLSMDGQRYGRIKRRADRETDSSNNGKLFVSDLKSIVTGSNYDRCIVKLVKPTLSCSYLTYIHFP